MSVSALCGGLAMAMPGWGHAGAGCGFVTHILYMRPCISGWVMAALVWKLKPAAGAFVTEMKHLIKQLVI